MHKILQRKIVLASYLASCMCDCNGKPMEALYYAGKKLHIIADNLSVHKHESVKEWVSKSKHVKLHYTPTYSSWIFQSNGV